LLTKADNLHKPISIISIEAIFTGKEVLP